MRGAFFAVVVTAITLAAGVEAYAQGLRPLPGQANTATPRTTVNIVSPTTNLDKAVGALTNRLASDEKQIAMLQGALNVQTTKLAALRSDFDHHDHYYTFATVSGNTQMLNTTKTTAPSYLCKKVGTTGVAADQYHC